MTMRFCTVEGEDFPESQFERDEESGTWFHRPPGENAHAADRFDDPVGPLPAPADAPAPEEDDR